MNDQQMRGNMHMTRIGRTGRAAALGMMLLIASVASAQEAPPAVTRHEARIAGQQLHYTAEVGRLAIRDAETGEPHGWMGYTAYRVAPVNGKPRPVTFIWNGGPGSPSILLHFSAVGPRRLEGATLVDNADSWLSASDLVLVDPIGTGFSRPAKSAYADEFYGTVGDTMSVAEFVRAWRLAHGAEESPVYLAGESWGAARAATVGYQLLKRNVPVAGLILISGGWALNSSRVAAATLEATGVTNMAAIALHYGKTAPDLGRNEAEVRGAAEHWAREVYAPALARVDSLTTEDRERIVAGLVRFTGIPATAIDRRTLVIGPRLFRSTLLKDQGKSLYIFDLRRTNGPGSEGNAAILHYFRHDLGYASDLPYLDLESPQDGYAPSGTYAASIGERWNYATAKVSEEEMKAAMAAAAASGSGPPRLGPPLPATEEAIALSPGLRVFVVGGLYDSFRPCGAGTEIARTLPGPLRDAIRFKCYAGGHAMYLDAPVRAELARDVRSFVTGAASGPAVRDRARRQ